SQPAHAWISGQLADAWGNADVGLEPPPIAVRLAADQHDIAWLEWEAAPTLNPETGLPYAFNQLPTLDHLSIWSTSTRRALAYGYLPAALISMHGTHLYERYHDFDADSDDERSEEHTSELQSRENLVCRLLLEKKKNKKQNVTIR